MLTALASQPVRNVGGDGDCDGIGGDDNEVERTQTRTETRTRTPSVSADTLADISRPQTGFSEIAEEYVVCREYLQLNQLLFMVGTCHLDKCLLHIN